MKEHPKISVVIPAYNEEKYISESLESLQNQTIPQEFFEVIVVDNNSTDKTAQIAESSGARLVGCQTQGVSAARATGSRAANGDIIAGTDADTVVAADWLEKILDHFNEDDGLVGLTGPTYFHNANPLLSKAAYISFDIFQRFNFLIKRPSFSGFNFAVRREAYNSVGGFNPELPSAEDIDLSLKLTKIGKVGYFSDVLVYTSARRLTKDPVGFFRHNAKNYLLMLQNKNPEGFKPIR